MFSYIKKPKYVKLPPTCRRRTYPRFFIRCKSYLLHFIIAYVFLTYKNYFFNKHKCYIFQKALNSISLPSNLPPFYKKVRKAKRCWIGSCILRAYNEDAKFFFKMVTTAMASDPIVFIRIVFSFRHIIFFYEISHHLVRFSGFLLIAYI